MEYYVFKFAAPIQASKAFSILKKHLALSLETLVKLKQDHCAIKFLADNMGHCFRQFVGVCLPICNNNLNWRLCITDFLSILTI